jgi:hypothetical protein
LAESDLRSLARRTLSPFMTMKGRFVGLTRQPVSRCNCRQGPRTEVPRPGLPRQERTVHSGSVKAPFGPAALDLGLLERKLSCTRLTARPHLHTICR